MTDASNRLQSISTELMIAFVFSIIAVAGSSIWTMTALIAAITVGTVGAGLAGIAGPIPGAQGAAGTMLIAILLGLLFPVGALVVSLLVMLRVNRMRNAASRGDARLLKELNSMGWAIIGLLAGIVPGVLMLVANSEINALPSVMAAVKSDFSADAMDKLMRLKQMVDSGTITQQDFELQKQRILHGSVDHPEPTEPEELRKLKSLLDCGAITNEEYEIHKQRFLEAL